MSRTRTRRAVALALAASAVAAPAAALAATPKSGDWKATKVQLGYDLKFKVKKGKITNIVAHVLENCTGESTSSQTTFAPDSSWKISKSGSFSGRHKETSGDLTIYYTFKGKFTGANKATGVLRSESIVVGATCDTHELKWTAKPGK